MSTLTSSVSPAASPRLSAYSHFRPPSRPTRSPKSHPSPSPPLFSSGVSRSSGPTQPLPRRSPQSQSRRSYVDEGTQYSPEGYPPTANQTATTTPATGSRPKRKPSPSSSVSPMSTTRPRTHNATPPPEPVPRDTPSQPEASAAGKDQTMAAGHHSSSREAVKRPRRDSQGLKIMSLKYETCDPKDLGVLIASMLQELITLNDKIPLRDGKLTRFHSRAPPGISCSDYLQRLVHHATLSPPIMLSMVHYIDKLCGMYPAFTISSLTVHRFLITAATVASKGLSDSFWTNPTYARIGGISTGELATLELDFLERVDFRIVPQPETLVDYYRSLVRRSAEYRLEGDGDGEADDGDEDMDSDPP